MNPVFEAFSAFVIWAEPDLVSAHRTPDEVLGINKGRVHARMERYLPRGASRLCSGILSLMAFGADSWEDARERLLEIPHSKWRDAIAPPSTPPEKLLAVISNPASGVSLLVEQGLKPDPSLGYVYASLLGHPKNLRQEIVSLLDDAWRYGLREWWERAIHDFTSPKGAAPSARSGDTITMSPLMLRAGEIRIESRLGNLVLLPRFLKPREEPKSTPQDTETFVEEIPVTRVAPAPSSSLQKSRVASRSKTPTSSARREPSGASSMSGGQEAAVDAELFKGLSDTTRLKVLQILALGPSFPSVMAEHLGITLPTMSHHLSALRAAGLVKVSRAKGFAQVSIDRQSVAQAVAFLQSLCRKEHSERE